MLSKKIQQTIQSKDEDATLNDASIDRAVEDRGKRGKRRMFESQQQQHVHPSHDLAPYLSQRHVM